MPVDPTPELLDQNAEEFGFGRGNWRFITCSEGWLKTAKVAIVTCNPGTDRVPDEHPRWSQEAGSAYEVEAWRGAPVDQAKLQKQIQRLVALLGHRMDETASWHAVPFATATEKGIFERPEILSFGVELSRWAFDRCGASVVICIGKDVPEKVVKAALGMPAGHLQKFPVAWGHYTMDVWRQGRRTVVALPHLSRFSLFGRPESDAAIRQSLDGLIGEPQSL